MDYLDEDAKPRFLFQSKSQQSLQIPDPKIQPLNKIILFITIPISILLFSLSFFFTIPEPLPSLLFWAASALLIGPFAPGNVTGGDVSVGQGSIFEFSENFENVGKVKKGSNFRQSAKPQLRSDDSGADSGVNLKDSSKNENLGFSVGDVKNSNFGNGKQFTKTQLGSGDSGADSGGKGSNFAKNGKLGIEESEWSEDDYDLLKKQMVKFPVGMPRRWEVITEAFKGRHKMENVVKMGKSAFDKKSGDGDSFAVFLKNRKPLDKRADIEINDFEKEKESVWSGEEDIALLNALKAFTKDATMRWEKIAAAVPGKTKSDCMKRVTDLKKGFRSSKASNEA